MATADEYAAWIVRNAEKRGTPEFDIVARAYKDAKGEPVSVAAGRGLMEIPRQVGLGARYLIEGVATIPEIVTEPIRRSITDPLAKALQPRSVSDLVTGAQPVQGQPLSKSAADLADYIGLPKPETADERVIGDASRMVISSAGLSGAARKAATALEGAGRTVAAKVAGSLGANQGTQALSAAAAGGAGGSVREAGGGPVEQFVAALGAGLAAPLAAMGVQQIANSAGRIVKSFNPQQVELVLQAELAKQGVDWAEIGRKAQLQLVEDAKKAVYSGQPMNPEALARLADYRRIGATPLVGDLTQDPAMITRQRNLSKQLANSSNGGTLPQIQNENAGKVLSTLESSATSPLDEYATGQGIIGSVKGTDAAKKAATDALYDTARDSQGRSLPLIGAEFTKRANEALKKNLAPKLGSEVDEILNDITNGKTPLTVEYAEQLKTMLGRKAAAAKATNGDLAYAYGLVRKALDETPLQGSGGPTLPGTAGQASIDAFNKARASAKGHFGWQESAKFVEDAIGGVPPDKFVRTHVIGSSVDDLTKLKAQIGSDPDLVNGVRKQLVDYIMKRGRADSKTTTFSGAGLEDGLKAVGDRKLSLFFTPEEIGQIKAAVNVARLSQSQPIGSAVNNSNSGALILGKVGDLLGKTADLPFIGPMVSAPAQSLLLKAQAAPMRNIGRALATTAEREPNLPAILPISALLAAPSAQARQENDRR